MKEKFAGEIIECLMQVYSPQWFGNRPPLNISLAIKCLSELRNPNAIGETAKKLLERILKLFEIVRWTQDINQFLAEEVVPAVKLVGDRSDLPQKSTKMSPIFSIWPRLKNKLAIILRILDKSVN